MCFEAFERTIRSSALKKVAAHWFEARGAKSMPGWGDIRPSKITAQLPIIWSYVYDADGDAFTGRIAGSKIETIFGKTLRGMPMRELYPAEHFDRLFERSKRVVCEPALYRGEGMVFRHLDHVGYGERITLPLARDGMHGDGLFGATDYQSFRTIQTDELPETDDWFEL